MSKITLAPNASGTGTLTIAAPNTNTDRTLTLPDVTTTLVGTDATQTLTNKSIAGSQLTGTVAGSLLTGTVAGSLLTGSVASSLLTGALPAISGAALTGIATGGMTLLGTLTTTSGTSQTLSGLTLTSYKQLLAVFKLVGSNATSGIILSSGIGLTITDNAGTSAGICGTMLYDLTNGILVTNASAGIGGTSTNQAVIGSAYAAVTNSSITTASTSITFSSAGTFNKGSILIYGVK